MIEFKKVRKRFKGIEVLNINDLKINFGEKIGIIGANGSGKTTLLRLLLDLIPLENGSIEINSMNVAKSDRWKEDLSAFLDNSFLLEYVTVKQYFIFFGIEFNENIDILRDFGLLHTENVEIKFLSSGQKKKVGIISTLLRNTKLKVFDEPTSMLDPESVNSLIKFITQDVHSTYIFTDHNMEFIKICSSRILRLNRGNFIVE